MRRMRRMVVLFSLLLAGLALGSVATPPSPIVSEPAGLTVTRLGADSQGDTLRLYADYKGSTSPAVYFDRDHDQVIVDFNDVDSSAVTAPTAPSDPLLVSWAIEHPHFRRARWIVTLRHPVPPANVSVETKNNEVSIALKRNWDFVDLFRLARGVKWYRREYKTDSGSLLVNELHVDLKDRGVHFDIGVQPHGKRTSTMVEQSGAIAGINGGFFSPGPGPLGLIVENGHLVAPPVGSRPPRTALGLTRDGHVIMDQVKVDNGKLIGLGGTDWSNVTLALGGGPRLVKDGRVDLTAHDEALDASGNNITYRTSRTAVAVMPDHRLILTTVTGILNGGRGGLLLDELAQYFVSIHARDAMCLDGGGSTSMAIEGNLVSSPRRTTFERKVADTLLVYDNAPRTGPCRLQLAVDNSAVLADGKSTVTALARVTTADGHAVPDGTRVFFDTSLGMPPGRVATSHGLAKVALVIPPQPGEVTISASCGFAQDRAVVRACVGPPAHLWVQANLLGEAPPSLQPLLPTPAPSATPVPLPSNVDPADFPSGSPLRMADADTPTPTPLPVPTVDNGELRYLVNALITDAAGNPIDGEAISAVTPAESFTRGTDASGQIAVIVAIPPGGATVRFTHRTLGTRQVCIASPPLTAH
ncbi:MAG: phosphodiester glycosidase family protein [Candidatus Xenobia bacterium]